MSVYLKFRHCQKIVASLQIKISKNRKKILYLLKNKFQSKNKKQEKSTSKYDSTTFPELPKQSCCSYLVNNF